MKVKIEYEIDFDITPYVKRKAFIEQNTISNLSFIRYLMDDSSNILCDITNDINRQIKEQIEISKVFGAE